MTEDVLLICAKPGFRRNGVAHAAKTVWPAGHWNDDQLEIFDNDPMFTVLSATSAEGDVVENTSAAEPDLASLDADNPLRMNSIDEVIKALGPADYGADGQPNIKALKELLGFVPMPEEIADAIKRDAPDGEPGVRGKAMRKAAIEGAAKNLGEGDFTRAGLPKISALEKAIGFKPTPEEIGVVRK